MYLHITILQRKKDYFSNQRQYHINNRDLEKETVPGERWQ